MGPESEWNQLYAGNEKEPMRKKPKKGKSEKRDGKAKDLFCY
jgi:hypothetical protein